MIKIGMWAALCCIVVLIWSAYAHVNRPTGGLHADIVLTEKGFVPQDVWIQKGGSVSFTTDTSPSWPGSDPHPTHEIYPAFDPKHPIQPGETWTFRFDRAGDWGFHDHLRSYFTGKIHVVP